MDADKVTELDAFSRWRDIASVRWIFIGTDDSLEMGT